MPKYDPPTVFTGTPADAIRQKLLSAMSPSESAQAAPAAPEQPLGNAISSNMKTLEQRARKARLRQLAEGTYE